MGLDDVKNFVNALLVVEQRLRLSLAWGRLLPELAPCRVVTDEALRGADALATGHYVRREMGGAYPLSVPLDVSVGVGSSWEDAGH